MTEVFDAKYHEAWKIIERNLEPLRPSKGKTVRVTEGRKHFGKVGQVFWHGVSKWERVWYLKQTSQQMFMDDLRGTFHYACGIDTGTERFFVPATDVEVIQDHPRTYEINFTYENEPRIMYVPDVTCTSEAVAEVEAQFPGANIRFVGVFFPEDK